MFYQLKFLIVFFALSIVANSQEGIPIYSDYLSDNYYLLHPSMAGAANCSKVRLTVRKQWLGQEDAPALQTLNFNGRVAERSGAGIILYNDKNGYHSEKGVKLTYAHHLMFSRDEIELNQLSFGISGAMIQSQLDQSQFGDSYDPFIRGSLQKRSYFNVDLGASYNFLNFYTHATLQNVLETRRELYSTRESDNLRKILLSVGYVFGKGDNFSWEPSVLFQAIETTAEKTIDLNFKAYKTMDFGRLWAAVSYRRSIEKSKIEFPSGVSAQNLQYITPIIGVNYKQFMFAYTYSNVANNVKFDNGAYHQITLGIDLFCKKERYDCHCPAVN